MLGIHSGQSLRIHLLGPELRLIFVGSSITASAAPKTRELLAYLILRARDPISRDGVASMLWPDVLDSEGRSNLRRHLSLLQRYLAPYVDEAAVLIENDSLRWNETAAWVDVYAFERLSTAPGAASAAIELYVADLLSRSDAEWLESERERLRTAAFNLLTKSMDAAERFDDVTRADRYACEMLRIDPFREEAIRRRMNYSARSGDRSAALKIFNDFERRLRDELGAEPMSQTRALRDLLASGREMGSRSASPVRDDLVGRARELEQIAGLLALRRLVTVAGAGGMGKTRVAERLVRDLAADFADGAVSVKLDALPPGSSVLDSIAAEVDVPQSRDDAMIRALVAFFGTKHMLLALDGCERDLPGVRLVAEALSRACPNLRILATSREPLRATGEAVFTLPPLSGIGAGTGGSGILDSDAATLFLMRARAAAPIPDLGAREIEALVGICARLDGIPLAIEIAASRCRVMTIVEIARRLDDAALVIDFARTGESRHRRTLRDIIAWAYDALEGGAARRFASSGPLSRAGDARRCIAIAFGSDGPLGNRLDHHLRGLLLVDRRIRTERGSVSLSRADSRFRPRNGRAGIGSARYLGAAHRISYGERARALAAQWWRRTGSDVRFARGAPPQRRGSAAVRPRHECG